MRTDNELMSLTKRGDEEAFSELVVRKRAAAENYARTLLRDDAAAQDAAQECFARLYALRDVYRTDFSFDAYFRAMLRNRCIDLLRARRAAPAPLTDDLADGGETPEAAYLRREEKARVLNALDALDEKRRALLLGCAVEGKSYRQLAREFSMTAGQVRITLHRIRAELKKAKGG